MPSEKIAVITDTCCDLPREVFKQYPIFCVPLVVTCGTESYRDNIDIEVEEIYARQKTEDFKTSLPRIQDIQDVYTALVGQGYTHVVVLMIAECLSSANNLMRLAAQDHPALTVRVFDSKSASIGLGALAVQTARLAAEGLTFDALCAQVEQLIDAYFPEGCAKEVRLKIYCYIAACGFLWSNWCEYKRQLGVEFGEYSLRQYRYAKEYYRYFKNEE